MKKKKIIIGLLILLIILYLIFKTFCLYYYDPSRFISGNYDNESKNFRNNNKVITIKKSNEIVSNYLENDSMKIKNIFTNFSKKVSTNEKNENIDIYALNNDKNNTAIYFGSITSYRDSFNNNINSSLGSFKYLKINTKKILKKYNIKDDIDLVKLAMEFKDKKVNFFTSVDKIKTIYALKMFSLSFPTSSNGISFIDGDYNGFYIDTDRIKEYIIIKNNKIYVISFYNKDYYSQDTINNILETMVLK